MGFLELRRQCGVSHEVGRGAQGASRVVPGTSGLHVRGEGERIIALELWYPLCPQSPWPVPCESSCEQPQVEAAFTWRCVFLPPRRC